MFLGVNMVIVLLSFGVMTVGPKLTRVGLSPGNFFTRGGFGMSFFMMSGSHLGRTALNLEFEVNIDGCLFLLYEFTLKSQNVS